MRKADPASNLMIDVPDQIPPLGAFPYYGFWQQIYSQLPKALQERTGFSKFDIASSLKEVEDVANGAFKVIVGEKLWKIGAILSLNQFVPANGQGGNTLGYIAESRDGGRAEIAAVCLEPIINSILQRASLSGRVGDEIGELERDYRHKLELMRTVMQRISELEGTNQPLTSINAARENYNGKKAEVNRLHAEIAHVEQGLKMTRQINDEMKKVGNELSKAEREQRGVIQQIEHWQTQLRNGENTGNGSVIANAGNRLTQLGQANAQLARTIEGLGVKLMRLQTQDTDPKPLESNLANLRKAANMAIRELSKTQSTYLEIEQRHNNTEAEMDDAQRAGARLSSELEALVAQIQQIRNSQEVVVAENESEIIRLWVNHLSGVYRDTEDYLFNNLRLAQKAAVSAQGGSIYMQKAMDASRIAEMEQFLSSVDMISDYLSDDEVKVLEQIARLGTVLNYLPGTARVMALRDMTYGQRKEAYRNMVDEMLELGERPSPDGTKAALQIGPLKFGKAEPLHEVAALLRHMTDTLME